MGTEETQPAQQQPEDINLSGYLQNYKTSSRGWRAVRLYRESSNPKVVQWVIRYSGGLVKDEVRAMYVLLGFVVLALAASAFLLWVGLRTGGPSMQLPPGAKLIQPPDGPMRLERPIPRN